MRPYSVLTNIAESTEWSAPKQFVKGFNSFWPKKNKTIGHLERVRTYYTAEAAALSRAAASREWDGRSRQHAMELIVNRMELARSAEKLWTCLLEI